jgi:Flp pilus assembly protein TadG
MIRRPPRLRRRTHTVTGSERGRSEHGSATIQLVVLLPALFALMFLGVQAALMYQGRTIALAAAQEGARDAASETGTAASGMAAASSFVSATTAGLSGTSVTGVRTAATARITVTTHTVSLMPGWKPTIIQSAALPVERVTG